MTGPDHHAEMEAHYAAGMERQDEDHCREVIKWLADLMSRLEEPLVGSFSNSLSRAGLERLSALMNAEATHPDSDTLRKLGAFDRKTKVDKHTATHWGYLKGMISKLDASGQSDVADVLIWQVWHQVNGVARAREFHRIEFDRREAAERDYHLICQEERRLRRLLTDGAASPQECAEFCKSARDDADGKPCLDCHPERFTF